MPIRSVLAANHPYACEAALQRRAEAAEATPARKKAKTAKKAKKRAGR